MKAGDRVRVVNLNHDHTVRPLPETERRLTGAVGTVVRPQAGRKGMIYVQLDAEPKGPVIVWPDELEAL